jgi:hypothetical protein
MILLYDRVPHRCVSFQLSIVMPDDVDISPLLPESLVNYQSGHVADSQVLLEDEVGVEEERALPQGTALSSFYNITNTILGSGMLAMV